METRIEILKNDVWVEIELDVNDKPRYNSVINRIGKIANREISHSNTFSIPNIYKNINALGLTRFNAKNMAKALNRKYQAKYYIDEKLFQEGFLVVNNVHDNNINVNFIDGALHLVEKWGKLTYYDLLHNPAIDVPDDYASAITEMRDYHMDKANILQKLNDVGVRGYRLGIFPNTLNTFGDKFQVTENGNLHNQDTFNPYQSRPIFGVQALLDLSIESFGYTADFDLSIDWNVIKKSFIVAEKMTSGQDTDNLTSLGTITGQPVSTESYGDSQLDTNTGLFDVETIFSYTNGNNNVKSPSSITNWKSPIGFEYVEPSTTKNCIYVPNLINTDDGTMHFTADITNADIGTGTVSFKCFSLWENSNGGDILNGGALLIATDNSNTSKIDIIIDKSEITGSKPSGAGKLIGIIAQGEIHGADGYTQTLENLIIVETYSQIGGVSFDDYGQYNESYIDLTFGAPKTTIKELLAAIMQKEGMLTMINSKNKTVKFFSYKQYQTRRDNGEYYDWSKFLQKHDGIYFDTNYGNEYAKVNEVGLTDPFNGNSHLVNLVNQGEESKYKNYAKNLVRGFKDVSKVLKILGSDAAHTYYEYKNTGQGLVETDGVVPNLTQIDASYDGVNGTQGTISNVDVIANVNYLDLPAGVSEWYKLVDNAVRIEAPYLLPVQVVSDFDISKPIYDEFLGGFFIVEEIPEYVDAQTVVRVKLIKLIDF